jgi:hypothetical protein
MIKMEISQSHLKGNKSSMEYKPNFCIYFEKIEDVQKYDDYIILLIRNVIKEARENAI